MPMRLLLHMLWPITALSCHLNQTSTRIRNNGFGFQMCVGISG